MIEASALNLPYQSKKIRVLFAVTGNSGISKNITERFGEPSSLTRKQQLPLVSSRDQKASELLPLKRESRPKNIYFDAASLAEGRDTRLNVSRNNQLQISSCA